MSLFSGFTDWIKGLVTPLTGTAMSAGANIASSQAAGVIAPATTAGLQQATNQALQKVVSSTVTASTDLLLAASKPVAKGYSYGVNRPLGTLALLDDPTSPLRKNGFNPSDVVKAWNRTEKVSVFQAATKSAVFQDSPIGQLSDRLLKEGHINLKQVNLWDDKDIKKNFVDNPIGRIFTGTGDFILSNVAAGGVTKLGISLGGAALRYTNFTRNIDGLHDLAKLDALGDAHGTYVQSKGAVGTRTNFGSDVEQLANSSDINLVTDKVRDYSNNPALPNLIAKTKDFNVVKDMLLADKGYPPAMERLMQTHGPDLYEIGDVKSFITSNSFATEKLPSFDPATEAQLIKVHNDSIAESAAHKKIYDAFMDPDGNFLKQGNNYKPVDPPVFGGMIGQARTRAAELSAASRVRDFSNVGGIAETVLGGGVNRPTSVLLHFFGTKLPRGYITYSGLRPLDHIDEVNAVIDNIPMFKNGQNLITTGFEQVGLNSVPIKVTASQYRTKVMNDIMNAPTLPDKAAIIDQLDQDLPRHIAYTHGITDEDSIAAFTTKARTTLQKTHGELMSKGYSWDGAANKLQINERTQRQITDTGIMLPHGSIEKEIIKLERNQKIPASGSMTVAAHQVAHNAFDVLNRTFSLSVLGRPAYVPKNSVIEPLVSASLAMGHTYLEDSIGTAISNSIKNNKNRLMSVAVKTVKKGEIKQVNQQLGDKLDALNQALHIRDNLTVQHAEALSPNGTSTATKLEHNAEIIASLRDAENLVSRLEAEASIMAKPYGKLEQIPSIYGLQRRMDFLRKNGIVSEGDLGSQYLPKKMQSPALAADIAIKKAIANVTRLSPDILETNKAIEDAWKLIDQTVKDTGLAQKEQAEVLSQLEKYKQRYYGSTEPLQMNIGGKTYTGPSLFDENEFGSAIRSEFSNTDTQELNFLNELRVGSKQSLLARKSPTGITDVNSPHYFEELSWVANRHFRGDPLVDQILADASTEDVMAWALSPNGKAYFQQFGEKYGVYTADDIPAFVNNQINTVRRYFPTPAARDYVLKNETTSMGLQKLLGDKLEDLSPVHPTDIDYGHAVTMGELGPTSKGMSDNLNSFWHALTSVENPFRYQFAEKRFKQIWENKLNQLSEAGVPITDKQMMAVRQSAEQEALKETEQTFYTVRRQNRAVYASRLVAAFPAASINAIFRFGRLGIQNPGRAAMFMKNYYSLFDSFGVDKNGNDVEDPSKAVYIVVPGTRELGINGGQGVMLSAKTVGFLVNQPGPSWFTTLVVGDILAQKPENKDVLSKIINSTIGHIPGLDYESLFPTGVQPDLGTTFIPSWIQDFARGIHLNSDKEFMSTYNLVHKYNMAMAEAGLAKPTTLKQDLEQTKNWYLERAGWKFGSFFGMTPKMDKPGQLQTDLANALLKKYNGDANKTQTEMLRLLGPAFKNLPVGVFTYRGQDKLAYVPPTMEAYKRVWEKNVDLTNALANIDPKLVTLMTMDLSGQDPDTQIQKFLSNPNVALPNGKKINTDPITPAEWDRKYQINQTWDVYRQQKDALLTYVKKVENNPDAVISDNPTAQAAWADFLGKLATSNKDWGIEYKASTLTDVAFKYAQGLKEITSNEKFMKENPKNDFLTQAKFFLDQRQKMVDFIEKAKKAGATGYTTATQDAWNKWLQGTTSGKWNPQLQQIIDRYFINDKLTGAL